MACCPLAGFFDDAAGFLLWRTHVVRSARRREGVATKASAGRMRHWHNDAESLERH